jgi:IS605 OrfB family transposase
LSHLVKHSILDGMKLVAAVKLLPTSAQAACLLATLARCNEAASWLAIEGHAASTYRQYDLHKMAYPELRARFGLTAQAAVRTIAKVADAFKVSRDAAPVFRVDAAQPYDDRILRFVQDGNAVSLWTLEGRMVVPLVMGEHQRALMAFRKGEVDLCRVRGKWILAATCDIPETEGFKATDWIGVDLGIVNIAADSDGRVHTGAEVERKRRRHQQRRNGLQKCGTKAAKRRLRKLAGKQARYQHHENHVISKALVQEAQRTGRGLAFEELKGIRSRVTARRSGRARLSNWSFGQLGAFATYKARLAGVPMVFVDPRNTSRQCAECGCIDKKNRPDQATFSCVSCSHKDAADVNAARNIRARATVAMPCVLAA